MAVSQATLHRQAAVSDQGLELEENADYRCKKSVAEGDDGGDLNASAFDVTALECPTV